MLREKRKFAVGAWVFTILLVVVLCGVIANFYYQNLPLADSLPYFGAVAFLAVVSVWLTKYHDEPGEPFTRASFAWKCILVILMAVNAAFCFYLGRHMAVARALTAAQSAQESEYLKRIDTLQQSAGPRAKLELARALKDHKAVDLSAEANAFREREGWAFGIMLIEFLAGGACVLTMMGLMIFGQSDLPSLPDPAGVKRGSVIGDHRAVMDQGVDGRDWGNKWEKDPSLFSSKLPSDEKEGDEFPSSIDVKDDSRPRFDRSSGPDRSKMSVRSGPDRSRPEALIPAIREALKVVGFHNHGTFFKADDRGDFVSIRKMKSEHQAQMTIATARFDKKATAEFLALSESKRVLRLKLFLNRKGFDLK